MLLRILLVSLWLSGLAYAETKPAKTTAPTAVETAEDMPAGAGSGTKSISPPKGGQVVALADGVPEVDSTSFVLVDFQSGEELAALNPGERVEPASITKLMTAYILYRELSKGTIKLDDEVLISQRAWEMQGSRMFVELGKKVQLEKLLRGLIIQSGNDAAVALAEHVAGSETAFVQRMNEVAKELGMVNTQYQNVTGWPAADHYTTARDIVILARALITEFPDRYKLYSEKEFTYNNIKQHNRNKLLWRDASVDGMKTGHTESAGFCLVASAKRDTMRLVSVLLGSTDENSRTESSQRLLEYGFRTFETRLLYKAGDVLSEKVRVWQGNKTTVAAGVIDDLYVSVGKGRYNQIQGVMQIDKAIDAPIRRGDVLGKIILSDQGKVFKEVPLLALEDITEGGLWRRMSDSVQKFFTD
ncbi:D-alanyl-D-alanine carboxypeptidase (penicillin-binding protein 5/6) [Thiothrix eikelboomii]|uniref:serine-type D-Ala-D-Ala carboxypeptidase n=1 Tax=Thiothrix eikelboomii TaxID=92487 RepID=A0A1T4VXF6_9GAMM|nr:D-alanyl-D-alanine carboxypeptidase family protein [Thiothrix eikelboomii]SKA69674.1 D-alanyl-D-alanine carboxypeptidase (penicillin-binding protein 5/6) [Thiothrix eikelboomii]